MAGAAKKASYDVTKVSALAELERLGIKFSPDGEDEVRVICPIHEQTTGHADSSPSARLNVKKNVWECKSCKARGDLVAFIAYTQKVERAAVLVDLSSRYDILAHKYLNPELIEKYHTLIWEAGPLLGELYARGVTEALIRKARLGYHNGRITIPIFDSAGNCVNIRHYLPGAPGPEKMRNTPGYGAGALYQIDQLKFDTIIICGGEMKALVLASILNEHGIGCVAGTSGEGNWNADHSSHFKDKRVYICLDTDHAGELGSRKIAGYIYRCAATVRILRLPLDPVKYPKGDVNDYIAREKATAKDFLALLLTSEEWHPPEIVDEKDTTVNTVVLSSATNAKYVNKWIEVEALVSSMDTDPYLIPHEIGVKCDKSQPNCSWCPMRPKKPGVDGIMLAEVPRASAGILDMANNAKKAQSEAIRESLRIPACKTVEFIVKSHYKVLDVRLSPQLNIGSESSKNVQIPAFVVADDIEMNTPYVLKGKVYPLPENQKAVLLLNEMKLAADSLTSFSPKPEEMEKLKIFRPTEWTVNGIKDRLTDIYNDFEANVTRIYQRHEMHLAIDLVYHSMLGLTFDGEYVKGWVEAGLFGDSSNGKSRAIEYLVEYYQLGKIANCENVSFAGILGGVEQTGSRSFISWGVIPTHDRRMVILEELGAAKEDVLSGLTDMRSKGIADISKIKKGRAFARTRLLFISNPRSRRPVSAYNFGIEIVKEIMVRPEDIRRLDFAIIVANSQMKAEELNKLLEHRPAVTPKYLSPECQRLILWAWTRKPEQIEFDKDAVKMIMEEANAMSKTFSDEIPLVDRGSMRHKLARLSASLAARTFSTSADMANLIVKPCHVAFIVTFLTQVYKDPVFGYADFSKAQAHMAKVADPLVVEKTIAATKYPKEFVESLLYTDELSQQDFENWMETDRDGAQRMISFLVRKHAIYRTKREYVKTSDFIVLLKTMSQMKLRQTVNAGEGEY